MRNLLQLLVRHKNFLCFLILEAVSLCLMFGNIRYHQSVMYNISTRLAGNSTMLSSSVKDYLQLRQINLELSRENAELRSQLKSSFKDMSFVEIDSIDSRFKQKFHFVPAEVVGNTTTNQHNFIILDKGSRHGIKPDMGVFCSNGIVGIITNVSENFSSAISVLNRDTRISAKLLNGDIVGTLLWNGINQEYVTLDDIPIHHEVASGDSIVTSGLSPVFPEGILIGTVDKTTSNGSFLSVKVKLSPDFNNLKYVNIVENYFKDEQYELESQNSK